jgi:hypothetical protein
MASQIQPITGQDALAVTKSDTTVYNRKFAAVWVGGAGDVAIRTAQGTTVTFVGAAAGSLIPVSGDMVMSTNTSATSIVAIFYG